ncbi:unnamed protein product, partial [Mesorhabditis belari]|uniref:Uncharacterized protein n=1 Tax=Mesorhabditis belari TaxID=2138241 RepID=A0AAF3FG34_9BILA
MIFSVILPFFALFSKSEAVRCRTCVEVSNGGCVAFEDCGNSYCVYEHITSNQMSIVRRSCQAGIQYKFDDGSVIDVLNRCVRKKTATHNYEIRICNDADYCNDQCEQAPGISLRRCHNCLAQNVNDCTGSTCFGRFCTYERRLENGLLRIEKGCTNETFLMLPDGNRLTDLNTCETRSYHQNGLFVGKLCDNGDYCNGQCVNPINPDEKTLQCSECQADNALDCNSGHMCTGKYCVFVREETPNSISVRRTCSNEGSWEFPDYTRTRTINDCESRTIRDVNYLVEVCNTGNNCANLCVQQPVLTTRPYNDPQVTCYMCSSSGADCYSGECRGNYCYYFLVYDRTSGQARSQRGCSAQRELELDDQAIDAYGSCKQLAQGDRIILANTCNSMNHCDSGCTQLAATLTREVVCTNCQSQGTSCQGSPCAGKYCYYYREFDSINGNFVHRGCSDQESRLLPNGKMSQGYGQCDYGNIGSTTFVFNSCNSTNFCDTLCQSAPFPLTTSTASWTTEYNRDKGVSNLSLFISMMISFWVMIVLH